MTLNGWSLPRKQGGPSFKLTPYSTSPGKLNGLFGPTVQLVDAISVLTPEVEWTDIWRIGLLLLNKGVDVDKRTASEDRIEWLKAMMVKIPYYRETILQELVIELILARDFEQAKIQLNMYTGEYPFIDNATLRGLSGLLHLYIAQLGASTPVTRPEGDHFFSSNSSDEGEIDELESKEPNNTNEERSTMNRGDITHTRTIMASSKASGERL
ncbi:hypothetical protein FS837_004394 [Tulasnella sp. UAMH 9824]|nr:hypothetical protein FS837_004394 [Tulasnella sp. UAMH 9824]